MVEPLVKELFVAAALNVHVYNKGVALPAVIDMLDQDILSTRYINFSVTYAIHRICGTVQRFACWVHGTVSSTGRRCIIPSVQEVVTHFIYIVTI